MKEFFKPLFLLVFLLSLIFGIIWAGCWVSRELGFGFKDDVKTLDERRK